METTPRKFRKGFIGIVVTVVSLIVLFIAGNPVGHNDAGHRQVIETPGGEVWVHFQNGYFWKGVFAATVDYPNILSVASESDDGHGVGDLKARFNDGSQATCKILTRFQLPMDEESMVRIHTDYNNPSGLVVKGLKPTTGEALRGAAQLMSSEMHYGGGRSQMSQWFQDQLDHGLYLLDTREETVIDSISKEEKTRYLTEIRMKGGEPVRKKSALNTYNITVAEALIEDVDYEDKIDALLSEKIKAQTTASVSKTQLVTAQQEAQTAEATGKKKLVEIQYAQLQTQTKLKVEAETRIMLAEKDEEKQKIALRAADLEARKIKKLADAEAYQKRVVMIADGALDKKLKAYVETQEMWATAFQNYKGNLVPSTILGGSGNSKNGGIDFMQIMGAKAAMDLNVDLKNKK